MASYDYREFEKKAQEKWTSLGLYNADLSDESRELYYLLVEFPYPSGDLHIGHWYAFAVTDIYARLLRLRGKNVLFPIGFDAFGLPAENAAIKHGLDPKEWTYKNIERMRAQLATMGASFDWSKEVLTCEPDYYQWTQWLFIKFFEQGLAERREASVKWCPKDQTVLANEQVVNGHCERCGTLVEERRLTQWFLKITAYAERLLAGLETLPWREEIKEAQRAWIGKSEGAYLEFLIASHDEKIKVFTTRPDTIFGATYVVLAPEHPLVSALLKYVSNKKAVQDYIAMTTRKTERERSENKEKTGVQFEGIAAINPATKEEIPIYIADYVLGSYGTGAVMAVPAHDERDAEFTRKFNLPVRRVIEPVLTQTSGTAAFCENEPIQDTYGIIALIKHWEDDVYVGLRWPAVGWSTLLTGTIDKGMTPEETVLKEIREEIGYTNIKFMKQIGMIHSKYYHAPKKQNRIGHTPVFYVELADSAQDKVASEEFAKHNMIWLSLEDLKPFLTATSHLAALDLFENRAYPGAGIMTNSGGFNGRANEEVKWDIVASVGGERATQYRLRDWLVSRQRYWGCPIPIVYDPEGKPHVIPAEYLPWLLPTDVDFKPASKAPLASSIELKERVVRIFGKGWTPEYDTLDTFVDSSWYFLRYLDSKNIHKFSDAALMKKWLPINRYSGGSEHTTMHLLYARFFIKALYDLALVPVEEPFIERFNRGLIMGPDGQKMSKSKGNVVNPDEFVQKYGADAVRIYLAFIGPYNEPGNYPWNLDGVASMRKFLERVTRLVEKNSRSTFDETSYSLSQVIARAQLKIVEDSDRFKFNTAVAALMVLVNELEKIPRISKTVLVQLVVMLAPFAPHLAEDLWEKLGKEGSVHQQSWPMATLATTAEQKIVVQVNGKKRGSLALATNISEVEVVAAALALPTVANALSGEEPTRVVYIPGKIINLIV